MQNVPNIVRDRLRVATPVSHPDADTLTAFSERLLADAERAAVVEHLAQCGECREVVALALPETETFPPTLPSPGSRWLTWPTLRWAFVAAGVAIVSVGVVKYQGSREVAYAPTANKASAQQQQDRAKTNEAPAAVIELQPTQDRDKVATALFAKEEAPPAAPGAEKARTSVSHMNRFHGSGFGAAAGGPLVSNQISGRQWQQQSAAQNQPTSGPPSGNSALQTTEVGEAILPPPGAHPNTQLAKNQPVPAPSGSGSGYAVDKAKLPVPPASPAGDMLRRQSGQQSARNEVRKQNPQPAPGQISGYVVDPSGAVVSNARITITPAQSGGATTAVTNSQGAWLIAGLPSGSYRAEAEAPGFKTTILDLNYDANQPSMFSFTLSPGNVSETVEVSSAQVQVQEAANEGTEMKPAVGASEARVLSMEQLVAISPARTPRWSITASGTLQRSFDQGNTWQDVNVSAARMTYDQRDLDVSASTQTAKDTKAARAKTKFAGKKDASSPTFRAVIANGADVWAGGLSGLLYHSTDSGNHWTQVVPSSAGSVLTGDIVSIEFPDPQHGKLSIATGETWITADSGQTWQKQ